MFLVLIEKAKETLKEHEKIYEEKEKQIVHLKRKIGKIWCNVLLHHLVTTCMIYIIPWCMGNYHSNL